MIQLPLLEPGTRLQPLLSSALRKASGQDAPVLGETLTCWDADFFGLNRTRLYRETDAATRQRILEGCCRNVLEEALFIEDAGMVYTARMSLLARTEQERVLYALFGADEATHHAWFKEALGDALPEVTPNAFHRLLTRSILDQAPGALVFLIQVFLEGWGIQRYGELQRACVHDGLRAMLASVLRDEARHHGSGVLLVQERRLLASLDPASREALVETLHAFLEMVRVGPQGVLDAFERATGGLTRDQRVTLLEELDTVAHSGSRLQMLRQLMLREKADDVVEALDRTGVFTPLPAEMCP
jgi:hypothetical protein